MGHADTDMQTVIIWDQLDGKIKFAVIDRDVTHLNNVYCNSCPAEGEDEDVWEAKTDELTNLFYDPTTGKEIVSLTTEFPIQAVKDGAAVITAGFLP